MSFNPWLITWEIVNSANPIPPNLIAAILSNRTPPGYICRIMRVLYYNDGHYVGDQLRGANPQYGHKVHSFPPFEGYYIGESPYLFGRHVFNFKVRDDDEYEEIATWEDHSFRIEENTLGEFPRHFKQLSCTYRKSQNTIETQVDGIKDNRPRKRRNRK